MKIIVIGGHLSPALCLIQSFPKDWEILFIGRKYVFEGEESLSLEYRIIKDLNITFKDIKTGRYQRNFTLQTVPSLIKIPMGFFNAYKIIKNFKPDIIIGFGGYVQFPVVFAALFLRVPVVLHEQTLEAGFSNKICSFFAKKICISWKSSQKFFPKKKTILTGIPIRKEIIEKSQISNLKPLIYVTGGSSGSHFINTLIEKSLKKILIDFIIIHQTGDSLKYNDFERLTKLRKKLSRNLMDNYFIEKFINPSDVSENLINASFVISRAGINTVSELYFLKKNAILIPLPFSSNNEQFKNASFLEEKGLALTLLQNQATAKTLLSKIKDIQNLTQKSKPKSDEFEKLLIMKASDKIIDVIKQCALKD